MTGQGKLGGHPSSVTPRPARGIRIIGPRAVGVERVTEPATVRLAVLIDADNVSASHASALLAELARYGVPTVKRAYGDWTTQQLTGWKWELARHAIQPIQQFANTVGKNSTDSALIIDAMDLLYSGNLDAFALVSSDSDFTRLATRLRESGKTVYGLGQRKTPASLQAACDKFIFLEVLRDEDDDADDAGRTRRPRATRCPTCARSWRPPYAAPRRRTAGRRSVRSAPTWARRTRRSTRATTASRG